MNKESRHRDKEILGDGPICMYHDNEVLNEDFAWFSGNNFEVFNMNCQTWTKNNFHEKIKEALFFPDYYGENLNAFDDCLNDMFDTKYRGLVLIFRNFDNLVELHRPSSEGILDSITRTSRTWLIEGQRLICLLQSNDPDLHFPELGGLTPTWNGAEWFDANRKSKKV